MSENVKNMQINLEASADDRKGNFANLFSVSSAGRAVFLDCYMVDAIVDSDDGQIRNGVLTSRVVMDIPSAISLRDMLDKHIENNDWSNGNA